MLMNSIKRYITIAEAALQEAKDNTTQAAERLDMSREGLRKKLK